MKVFRYGLVVMAIAVITFGLIGTASAFHKGGVAECGGCHSMHTPAAGGSFLLVGATASSTCLSCHDDPDPRSYHISTSDSVLGPGIAPVNLTPGGDFAWLKKDYTFTVRGTTSTELGQTHGHNIIAADFNYTVDTDNPTAPGGTFDSNDLGCLSCHDPHSKSRRLSDGTIATGGAPIIDSGSYNNSLTPGPGEAVGVYRLLAGATYQQQGTTVTFPGTPIAVAPSSYNGSEATNQRRVAYSAGSLSVASWGNWCASCHPDMHSQGATGANYVHPIDQNLGSTIAGIYNNYKKSGDMTGDVGTSYLSLVPFMENTTDITTLKLHANSDGSYTAGPASTDQVSCLSCHRAHASGWEYMLRWNMEGELITYNSLWPGTDTTPTVPQYARGRTSAEVQQAYYDRPASMFASYQRVLCNKCHGKD